MLLARERAGIAFIQVARFFRDRLCICPDHPQDQANSDNKHGDFQKCNHTKLSFCKATLVDPTIYRGSLTGYTNQMIGVLALAELIDVGKPMFLITHKPLVDTYFIYEFTGDGLVKLGKGQSPSELEKKFDVKRRIGA